MTNLVPHDIEEWMRTQERRYNDLATRRTVVTATNISTPRWKSRLDASATITTGTFTNLGYSVLSSAPDHDPGDPDFASNVTVLGEPRILFATAGLYLVRASLQWNVGAGGTRKIHLMKNAGTTPIATMEGENAGAASGLHIDVVDVIPFDVNDYLRIACFQNSGGNVGIIAAGSAGQFAASMVTIVPMGAYSL